MTSPPPRSGRSSSGAALPGVMPDRLPETAPEPNFDAASTAKILLRAARAGTLATLDRNTGHPFASLVNVATDSDGSPLILISRLSTHTANLEADSRASVLLAATGKGDPLAHPRLTVLGTFVPIARDHPDEPRLRRRYLARHPKSELYAGFADFSFWRMLTASAHLNAGFARAADLSAADLMTELADATEMIETEASAVAHMNADHADAVQLYASKLLGAEVGAGVGTEAGGGAAPWRLTGLDPDGVDLARGDVVLRLPFRQRVTSAAKLREILADLAREARAR